MRSLKFISIAVAALLTACGGGGSGGDVATPITLGAAPATSTVAAPASPDLGACHVVIYGDSIIADPLLKETIPQSIARQRPTWTVDNRAVGGQTAAQGATAYGGDVLPQGSVVVVEWGINDLILQRPFAPYLEPFVKYEIAQGYKVVITGIVEHPASGELWDNYNLQLLTMATSDGAAFASWGEVPITTFDGTHPDDASTEALVEDLLNSLDKECPNG